MVVFKYPIHNTECQVVSLPTGAKILSVQEQRGELCLWALADHVNATSLRRIRILHTGQYFNSGKLEHISTLLLALGDYVLHIFEETA